jgi:hypothetical protein
MGDFASVKIGKAQFKKKVMQRWSVQLSCLSETF